MKPKIVTQWSNDHRTIMEVNTKPSLTIPDQSMTIREILERYARGLPLGGQKVPIYNGEDDDMPDLERLDISEKHELFESVKDEIESLRKKSYPMKTIPKDPPGGKHEGGTTDKKESEKPDDNKSTNNT